MPRAGTGARVAGAAGPDTADSSGTVGPVATPSPDDELAARAAHLSRRYLGGHARPRSVRWVDTMQRRWGSCTPLEGTIRISRRVAAMPEHVRDYVLLHELAHLLISGHGPDFWVLLGSYPHLERAKGFLEGVDHASST